MQRYMSSISADVKVTIQNDLKSSHAFSLVLDESTDVQDTLQLVIVLIYFIR